MPVLRFWGLDVLWLRCPSPGDPGAESGGGFMPCWMPLCRDCFHGAAVLDLASPLDLYEEPRVGIKVREFFFFIAMVVLCEPVVY